MHSLYRNKLVRIFSAAAYLCGISITYHLTLLPPQILAFNQVFSKSHNQFSLFHQDLILCVVLTLTKLV